MRHVTLEQIFEHHITQKYVNRSGMVHAITVAYHAFHLAKKHHASVDAATKAGFLHDIGHHTWYSDGKWDYELYKKNDIHAIKGAERAHKLLIRLGEHPKLAKEISIAILLHTDSFLVKQEIERTPLQQIIKWADEADEEPGGAHHYRTISYEKARKAIQQLDQMVERELQTQQTKSNKKIAQICQ
ncbi:HD domain-containing protein [Bacillus cytotoxicus]|uniref:HD domain-containing protein n=1 Tax=Bacillus cereus group sp. BfR-BA-01492 TaxID=2920361 RepID=UPI001F57CAF4|nr:HD domain-containing protein [Bacillus cereus group sp. BfR-BA-01492]EMA6342711.1 HD domain-containing protein [Bacillus cytotoxicus]